MEKFIFCAVCPGKYSVHFTKRFRITFLKNISKSQLLWKTLTSSQVSNCEYVLLEIIDYKFQRQPLREKVPYSEFLWSVFSHIWTEYREILRISPYKDWSRADLSSVYQFWGHLILAPKFKKGRKRKTNALYKNKKLPSATLFSKLNIKSESIKDCVRYIFTSLFCMFKWEDLWGKEKWFLFHFESSFRSWDNQVSNFQIFRCYDVIKCLSIKHEINFIE